LSTTHVRAVTFDVGGTLIQPWPSVGHIYAEEAFRHGCPNLHPEVLNRQFTQAWQKLDNFRYTRPEWAALVDGVFAGLTDFRPSRTFFSALYARFARADAWRIYPDVLPALKQLQARGLRLGVISNWDRRLRPLLRALNLYGCFDAIIVSCDHGIQKPAPEIFRQAARKLGVQPVELLHVGDSPALDAQGARAAGCRGIWLGRDLAAKRPDDAISSLSHVAARIDLII
jgi:putative hydrolase of the HAD superfamily